MSEQLLKKDYYYDLPEELIAQDPLSDRSSSRLMIVNKNTGKLKHGVFTDIKNYIRPGDVMVINDTKVIPARLIGIKTGDTSENSSTRGGEYSAKIEVLLLKRHEGDVWETLVKPGKKARTGAVISFGDGRLTCEVVDCLPDGNRMVKFNYKGIFEEVLDSLGEMPLPPYITHKLQDRNRYQTVYAKNSGSAAAPTAGLHFTEQLLKELEDKGVIIAHVTLHVGLGTFRPVKEENLLNHQMHTESYEVLPEEAKKINDAVAAGGRLICVGTTSCRTIESVADENGIIHAGSGDTQIFIYPGYKFKALKCLITNFHLPESTLIMLVSALAGRENVLAAYKEAVEERYRFFSFGDAMFLTDDEF